MVPASTHSMEPPGTATTPGVTAVAVLTSDRGDRISPTVLHWTPNSKSNTTRGLDGSCACSVVECSSG